MSIPRNWSNLLDVINWVLTIVIPPGKSSPMHHHDISDETYYILKGEARVIIDGNEQMLTIGDTVIIKRKSTHQIFNDSPINLEFLAISSTDYKKRVLQLGRRIIE